LKDGSAMYQDLENIILLQKNYDKLYCTYQVDMFSMQLSLENEKKTDWGKLGVIHLQ
jgi:hypothetical protein